MVSTDWDASMSMPLSLAPSFSLSPSSLWVHRADFFVAGRHLPPRKSPLVLPESRAAEAGWAPLLAEVKRTAGELLFNWTDYVITLPETQLQGVTPAIFDELFRHQDQSKSVL